MGEKKFDVVIAASINPELILDVKNTPGPKKESDMRLCLAGSSATINVALGKLGYGDCHLLGLVEKNYGQEETLENILLQLAIKQSGVSFTPLRVLDKTSHATVPIIDGENKEVWGKKGDIIYTLLPQALHSLTQPEVGIGPETFVVITGMRAVEIPFARVLLSRAQHGFRVLNAKEEICASGEFKEVLPLVDMLMLNKREFEATGMQISELHHLGPRIVVVTQNKEGGVFSFSGGCCWAGFDAVCFPGGKFETGVGDWFLGGLISELIRLEESVLSIEPEQFEKVINFAACVAGKKITIPGGGNGPSRSEL